ncbi:MAG: EAL domain-containing protein, partial [Acidaminococcaceae bacterium]|nr:EAL domain-containing protein [Acidaminococcaceae bacterium]
SLGPNKPNNKLGKYSHTIEENKADMGALAFLDILNLVVEGVETGWQYERLKEFGADTIQGYYFSKPLEPKEAIAFQNANS